MGLRSIFLPDNKKFFQLFDKVAEHLKQMSTYFAEAIQNREKIDDCLQRLDELERANDIITHKIFIELGRNFITPFDREDIHYLASGLDDIADDMLGVIRQMRSHKINGTGDEAVKSIARFNTIIINKLAVILHEMKNTRSLNLLYARCAEIQDVLTEADSLVEQSIHSLFAEHKDAITIIRRMDHYEKLQQLLSRISNVIHVIESVIIKYG